MDQKPQAIDGSPAEVCGAADVTTVSDLRLRHLKTPWHRRACRQHLTRWFARCWFPRCCCICSNVIVLQRYAKGLAGTI